MDTKSKPLKHLKVRFRQIMEICKIPDRYLQDIIHTFVMPHFCNSEVMENYFVKHRSERRLFGAVDSRKYSLLTVLNKHCRYAIHFIYNDMLLYKILHDVEHFRSQLLGRETNNMSCPEHCCTCKIYIQVKTVTQKAGSQFQHHAA